MNTRPAYAAALSRASLRAGGAALVLALLAACSSTRHQAPVEQRGSAARPAPTVSAPSASVPSGAARPLEAARPAAVTGSDTYTVKGGDTLQRIALDHGQNWRDIVRWNALSNPNALEIGQVLRVQPPPGEAVAVRTPAPTRSEPGATGAAPAAPPVSAPAGQGAGAREVDEAVTWGWPAAGKVHTGFNESKQKGIVIQGTAGDPVLASADGRVVYAGSGLRGYGNLLIVKHNNTYLSAYAHNQALLVKEDQAVKRGQKIAEMGSSDADRVQLHFEIRRQGKPIDPSGLLPQR